MAKHHPSNNHVALEIDVPADLLDDEGRRLLGVFYDLNDERLAKQDEAADARDMPRVEAGQVAEAASNGKSAPKELRGEAWWQARSGALSREATALARRQVQAGHEFETYVTSEPSFLARVAEATTAASARAVDLTRQAHAADRQSRALADLARTLAVTAAQRSATTAHAGSEATQAVHDHFAALHKGDAGHLNPSTVATAWNTVLGAVQAFPGKGYAVIDPASLLESGAEAQRQAALAPKGVETDSQRIARLRALAGATTAMPRPAQKTLGHMTADEIKAVADARRAHMAG